MEDYFGTVIPLPIYSTLGIMTVTLKEILSAIKLLQIWENIVRYEEQVSRLTQLRIKKFSLLKLSEV